MEEEKKVVNSGIKYKNTKYRPSVFINSDKRKVIENRIDELNLKSFNEYVKTLIEKDIGIEL